MDTILKKNQSKITFTLSVFVISSLCYIPLIANGYVNSIDGIWHSNTFFQSGNLELSSGRWAWLFLDKLKGGYAAEPFYEDSRADIGAYQLYRLWQAEK